MTTEARYYAKPGPIAPLALVDERIGIWVSTQWECYRVSHYEQIPKSRQFIQDFGALAAAAWTNPVSTITILQQGLTPPEAFQLRFYPLDDIEVLFAIGQADVRFKTSQMTARADITTMQVDPDLASTEVVVLTNGFPFLNIYNPTGYALGQTRVVFFGYRYALDSNSHKSYKSSEEARKDGPITLCASGGF